MRRSTARGEMENGIKECPSICSVDRTSAATMHANQLRLWFASISYVTACRIAQPPKAVFVTIFDPQGYPNMRSLHADRCSSHAVRCRRWGVEEKLRIVAETHEPVRRLGR